MVEFPKEIDLVVLPDVVQYALEQAKLFVSNDPAVKLTFIVEVNALPSVQPPPTPLKIIDALTPNEVPLVVIVLPVEVALNVISPLADQTVPETKLILPLIAKVGVVPSAKVTVPADTVISRQVNAPVQVTV
jgi:hypothetical protein